MLNDALKVGGYIKMAANEDETNCMINLDEYLKVTVSLLEVNTQSRVRNILCFGTVITSTLIIITKICDRKISSVEKVTILSGIGHSTEDDLNLILVRKEAINELSLFVFLVVSSPTMENRHKETKLV